MFFFFYLGVEIQSSARISFALRAPQLPAGCNVEHFLQNGFRTVFCEVMDTLCWQEVLTTKRRGAGRGHDQIRFCTGVQTKGYTGVHRGTQGYTGVHRGTQGYTGIHRRTLAYTGVHRGTQGYTGVHRGT